ncbi:hypothetical protein BGZ96_006555, partial [Linnemannia gamsii]
MSSSASHILHRGRSVFSKLNKKYRIPASASLATAASCPYSPAPCSHTADAFLSTESCPSGQAHSRSNSTSDTQNNNTTTNPQDLCKAQQLFDLAQQLLFGRHGHAKDESAAAQGVLAFCFEFGLGLQANYVEAERLYILAAEKGDGLSLSRLAFLRKYGRPSVKIDRIESEYWQQKINQQ